MSNTTVKEVVTLRPTFIANYMACPKKLAYALAGITPKFKTANLVFGCLIHEAIEHYLRGELFAGEMVPWFCAMWKSGLKNNETQFPKSKAPDVYEAIGCKLLERFPSYYQNLGIKCLYSELPLKVDLGDSTLMNMTIDYVGEAQRNIYSERGLAIAKPGDTVIIDWKTQMSSEPLGFASHSFQFGYYWAAITAHADALGIAAPTACGYAAGLKPNASKSDSASVNKAQWEPITYTDRTPRLQREAINVALKIADDVREGRLYRHPGMAFNTPCDSVQAPCDFLAPCVYGELGGLKVPAGVDIIAIAA